MTVSNHTCTSVGHEQCCGMAQCKSSDTYFVGFGRGYFALSSGEMIDIAVEIEECRKCACQGSNRHS